MLTKLTKFLRVFITNKAPARAAQPGRANGPNSLRANKTKKFVVFGLFESFVIKKVLIA